MLSDNTIITESADFTVSAGRQNPVLHDLDRPNRPFGKRPGQWAGRLMKSIAQTSERRGRSASAARLTRTRRVGCHCGSSLGPAQHRSRTLDTIWVLAPQAIAAWFDPPSQP